MFIHYDTKSDRAFHAGILVKIENKKKYVNHAIMDNFYKMWSSNITRSSNSTDLPPTEINSSLLYPNEIEPPPTNSPHHTTKEWLKWQFIQYNNILLIGKLRNFLKKSHFFCKKFWRIKILPYICSVKRGQVNMVDSSKG